MKSNHHPKSFLLIGCCLFIAALHGCGVVNAESPWQWETVQAEGQPTARHEAALAAYDGKVFLIGGRRINPVDVFDPATRRWTAMSPTPMELHHFQAVVVGDVIYLMGAMTGRYPGETPLERVVAYYPKEDEFRFLHPIPTARRRGGAGAVYCNGKIYLVGGITNGHIDGFQPWLDSYDPETGDWETLPDAPHARDHFQAVVCNNRLYAIGGRTTHQREKNVFGLTVDQADVFDFKTMSWLPPDQCPNLPTPRAGNMAMTWGDQVLVGGGESGDQKTAHDEVEAWDTGQQKWSDWPSMNRGRHGSGFVEADGFLYTASGSGNRGGGPELTSIERLHLP